MSATSSVRSVSEMLQQPMPEATKRYVDKLAAEINARGQGLTEDDLWIAQGRLKGVPRETLQMWLDVRMHSDPPVQSSPGSFSSPLVLAMVPNYGSGSVLVPNRQGTEPPNHRRLKTGTKP
ncbi:hypothetical protein BDD12DRAFT_805964 [Trichophaea hybrida]|nr:hypothetical protein BDD12DRAFT_805964 [Trichophaea hybrida]